MRFETNGGGHGSFELYKGPLYYYHYFAFHPFWGVGHQSGISRGHYTLENRFAWSRGMFLCIASALQFSVYVQVCA